MQQNSTFSEVSAAEDWNLSCLRRHFVPNGTMGDNEIFILFLGLTLPNPVDKYISCETGGRFKSKGLMPLCIVKLAGTAADWFPTPGDICICCSKTFNTGTPIMGLNSPSSLRSKHDVSWNVVCHSSTAHYTIGRGLHQQKFVLDYRKDDCHAGYTRVFDWIKCSMSKAGLVVSGIPACNETGTLLAEPYLASPNCCTMSITGQKPHAHCTAICSMSVHYMDRPNDPFTLVKALLSTYSAFKSRLRRRTPEPPSLLGTMLSALQASCSGTTGATAVVQCYGLWLYTRCIALHISRSAAVATLQDLFFCTIAFYMLHS
ncbi:uncharacterized protein G2W53_019877 [Senna tora]|uniref:Uncharacterized protein n=1 Tax=Senna tora TaxID=362788 RepID=A0A834TV24_9FABA|nr:uncharacterized protein G2W53_019877 [Senna tora]